MTLVNWLIFHASVGFFTPAVFVYALVICFAPSIFVLWQERTQWQEFHSRRQLDRAREILEATQTALRCMFSSLWDASCTCDVDGVISSSTPHLEQLLAGGENL